ncbi:hypothetical protein BI364_08180 [Acidihalobacter yilgarnensis]|uniref:Blue (type 1) copper domain-containing protein n=1 Tax=Acidihalobacter yilgarnensis TaxID=2819280 RepID=A0A1D8INF0_9GAMM|nr:hypothetical protein [Acidihalobacter yilgarnensis]AOU97941.1 hypothetical protein BI364_08180 [Acidihalobacter yilgarnensis]
MSDRGQVDVYSILFGALGVGVIWIGLGGPLAQANTDSTFQSESWSQVQRMMKDDTGEVGSHNQIQYSGDQPIVVVEQVLPGFSYPSFEVDGLKNPTLTFTKGARITFYVINTSQVAPHTFAVTQAPPPYAIVPTDHRVEHPLIDTGKMPILSNPDMFSYTRLEWTAPVGKFYYLCLFPTHAAFGMWGRIVVPPIT